MAALRRLRCGIRRRTCPRYRIAAAGRIMGRPGVLPDTRSPCSRKTQSQKLPGRTAPRAPRFQAPGGSGSWPRTVIHNSPFLHQTAVSETGRCPDSTAKARRLDGRIPKSGQRRDEHKIQDILDQNEISVTELEKIFPLDEFREPETLEGLLSGFVDGDENSLEMVRAVRYNA